jgi:hypothetical protein
MTSALYDQNLLDDPETPVFNAVLDMDCDRLDFVLSGDWATPPLGDTGIMSLIFEVDADHYRLAPSQIPTVAQIEAQIDAGIVPLVTPESKHRQSDEDDEPQRVEDEEAAFSNRNS